MMLKLWVTFCIGTFLLLFCTRQRAFCESIKNKPHTTAAFTAIPPINTQIPLTPNMSACLISGATYYTWRTREKMKDHGFTIREPVSVILSEDVPVAPASGSIAVEQLPSGQGNPTDNFDPQGYIMISREIIRYARTTANTFEDVTRGCFGSPVEFQDRGSRVSNNIYLSLDGGGPDGKVNVYCVDSTPPTAPSGIKTDSYSPDGTIEISWEPARDGESGIEQYEVQEQTTPDLQWKTVEFIDGGTNRIRIGDGNALDAQGNVLEDQPRRGPRSYAFRVRAHDSAGSWSDWSPISSPVAIDYPARNASSFDSFAQPAPAHALTDQAEILSSVSSYPNPVDSRKGGEEGKANIIYVLNQDCEVTITIYDLLGYEVTRFVYFPGGEGGRKGDNKVQWDCTNSVGDKVAKGGYIAQIRATSSLGIVTVMRKIGVIH
jgi:hypothetical protein